jgi:hypothetical protein
VCVITTHHPQESDVTEVLVSASKIKGDATVGPAANRVLQALTMDA